jgi:hypothetical protein
MCVCIPVWDAAQLRLSFYTSNKDATPQKTYWLCGPCSLKKATNPGDTDKFYFKIVLAVPQNDEDVIMLAANSSEERNQWLRALWHGGCSYSSRIYPPFDEESSSTQKQKIIKDYVERVQMTMKTITESTTEYSDSQASAVETDGAAAKPETESADAAEQAVEAEFNLYRNAQQLTIASTLATIKPLNYDLAVNYCFSLESKELETSRSLRKDQAAQEEAIGNQREKKIALPSGAEELLSLLRTHADGDPTFAPAVPNSQPAPVTVAVPKPQSRAQSDYIIRAEPAAPGPGRGDLEKRPPAASARPANEVAASVSAEAQLTTVKDALRRFLLNEDNAVSRFFLLFVTTFIKLYNRAMSLCPVEVGPPTDAVAIATAKVAEAESVLAQLPWKYHSQFSAAFQATLCLPRKLYAKYLTRVRTAAVADIQSFRDVMFNILNSPLQFGGLKHVSAKIISGAVLEVVAKLLFAQVYPTLDLLYQRSFAAAECKLNHAILEWSSVSLRQCGLSESLCLDERLDVPDLADSIFEGRPRSERSNLPSPPASPGGLASFGMAMIEQKLDKKREGSVSSNPKPTEKRNGRYQRAVDLLLMITESHDPWSKVEAVVAVRDGICACVDACAVKGHKDQIDADDLLLIITFLIVMARIPHLFSQLQLSYEFLNPMERCLMYVFFLVTSSNFDYIYHLCVFQERVLPCHHNRRHPAAHLRSRQLAE